MPSSNGTLIDCSKLGPSVIHQSPTYSVCSVLAVPDLSPLAKAGTTLRDPEPNVTAALLAWGWHSRAFGKTVY